MQWEKYMPHSFEFYMIKILYCMVTLFITWHKQLIIFDIDTSKRPQNFYHSLIDNILAGPPTFLSVQLHSTYSLYNFIFVMIHLKEVLKAKVYISFSIHQLISCLLLSIMINYLITSCYFRM